jgi:DNA-binding transcriptional ArsR family regulator
VRTTVGHDVFRAIADPSRRRLLNALLDGPRSFGELHGLLPVTKGAVSQHLSILANVGLIVVSHEDGRRYALTPAPLSEIAEWVDGYRAFWESKLDNIEKVLALRAEATNSTRVVAGLKGTSDKAKTDKAKTDKAKLDEAKSGEVQNREEARDGAKTGRRVKVGVATVPVTKLTTAKLRS